MSQVSLPTRFGPYDIDAELGRGAFATVYRATEQSTGRVVAIKVLHPELLADRRFVELFEAEAETVRRLAHPNIVAIFHTGVIDGRLCQIMTYAQGGSLADHLRTHGPLSWETTLGLLRPIAAALDHAHAHKVIHRDLKPANILIDAAGVPLLSDFGLAALVESSSASRSLSQRITGTFQYLAPELWGEALPSPQSDIYALACVIGEMLTGKPLFPGETMAKVFAAHHAGPRFPDRWPDDVPSQVKDVLRHALTPDPRTRPRSATAMVDSLAALRSRQPQRATRGLTFAPWIWLLLGALSIGGVGGVWVGGRALTPVSTPQTVETSIAAATVPLAPASSTAAPRAPTLSPTLQLTATAIARGQAKLTATAVVQKTAIAAATQAQAATATWESVIAASSAAIATSQAQAGSATETAAVNATARARNSAQETAQAQSQQATAQAAQQATNVAQSQQATADAAAATAQALVLPVEGKWEGQTSQGDNLAFWVKAGHIVNLTVWFVTPGGACGPWHPSTWVRAIAITNNQFSSNDGRGETTIVGSFSSSTTAAATTSFHYDDGNGCVIDNNISWEAKLVDPTNEPPIPFP